MSLRSVVEAQRIRRELMAESVFDAEDGITLIELVVVIVLVALIGSFVVFRMDSLVGWKVESEIRRFSHTLQLARNDSIQRHERYRVLLNLDQQTYSVRREVPLDPGEVKEVDYLENLRTQGEQARRVAEAEEELLSLEEEFSREDLRRGGALEQQYYQAVFADPQADVRLGAPLSFPSLAEAKRFDSNIRLRDVEIAEERHEEGTVALRFLSTAPSPPALIHFEAGEQVYTIALHLQLSQVRILSGDLSAEDAYAGLTYEEENR